MMSYISTLNFGIPCGNLLGPGDIKVSKCAICSEKSGEISTQLSANLHKVICITWQSCLSTKVCRPYVVTFLNQTPTFERYVLKLVVENGYREDFVLH